jgi:Mce-associated membrane protein
MAADAGALDGEPSRAAGEESFTKSPDHNGDGSPASPEEGEVMSAAHSDAADDEAATKRSHVRLAMVIGLAIVAALAGTVGWLGFRANQSHQAQAQRQMYLQVGRQGALNLTTIDWQHAEGDVQRVLDSATGQFYDQFSQRKQPFIDVVKKAQSKSVGTITEAGVESDSGDKAQVLVAVSIKTTNLGAADESPREWRMRITVEKSGAEAKISKVAFVP